MGTARCFGQTPSLGDPLFMEDFGTATIGASGNGTLFTYSNNKGEQTNIFRNEPIDYIKSLLFYTPEQVPNEYGTWGDPNWGPRYVDDRYQGIGSYSIVTNSAGYKNPYFYSGYDHTTNDGTGYMLLVDAHSSTTLYFDRVVEDLCAGTAFQFSVWIKNINNENNLPKPKITLDIFDNDAYVSSGGTVTPIASHTTDDTDVLQKNIWYELKMNFNMPANVSTIRLQIRNAVEEYRGNDLAMDDITFRPMGPPITLSSNYSGPVCVGYDVQYDVEVSEGAYSLYYYQLQRRKIIARGNDPEGKDFENVGTAVGPIENNRYTFTFPATLDDNDYEYRVIAAGDPLTLTNKNCRTVSNAILLRIHDFVPLVDATPTVVCQGDASVLRAALANEADTYEFLWQYSNISTGGQWVPIENASSSVLDTGPLTESTQYRVLATIDNCTGQGFSDPVEVMVVVTSPPTASVSSFVFCERDTLTLADLVVEGTEIKWYSEEGTLLDIYEPLVDGGMYYATQTIDGCESVDRLAVSVKINHITAGKVSGDQTVCPGTVPAPLLQEAAALAAGDLTYRWERSLDGVTWETIDGATAESYFPPVLTQTTFFRRVALSTLESHVCERHSETIRVMVANDCDLVSEKYVEDENKDGLAQAGEQLTYRIRIQNHYDREITVDINDDVPAFTRFVKTVDGAFDGKSKVVWPEVKIPGHSSLTVEFTVVVNENLTQADYIENVATVTIPELGESQSPSVRIDTDPEKSFFAIKTADKQSVRAGEELSYTIKVTNTGNIDYTGIVVTDDIPRYTAYKEGSVSEGGSINGNVVTWAVDVPFGQSREVSFTVVVAEDLTDISHIRNVAKVRGEDPNNPEQPSVDIPTIHDKQFESVKSVVDADGDGYAQAGEQLTYQIHIKNTGTADYNGITVEDDIPLHTSYVTGSATNGGELNNGKLRWTIDVPYGAEASVSFKVRVVDEPQGVGFIRNVATVTGGTPDQPEVEYPESPEIPVIFGPTAIDDSGTTAQGDPLTISALENDLPGSRPLVPESVRLINPISGEKATVVSLPGEGRYAVTEFGTVIFTPEEPYIGQSTVSYIVKNEHGLESNVGVIRITVEGVAAEIAPVALDDHATTGYKQPVEISVLANDQPGSSPIVPASVRLIDASGNRTETVTIPGEGRFLVNEQGTVAFEPTEGFTGISVVSYVVNDENGLVSNTATISVDVSSRLFKIPNVFTPNGDGRNDVFEIVGIEQFDRLEITVVNRWGNEVYRNTNYKNEWDGQGLNEGTYYYVIFTHSGRERNRYAGWVLIKRK